MGGGKTNISLDLAKDEKTFPLLSLSSLLVWGRDALISIRLVAGMVREIRGIRFQVS